MRRIISFVVASALLIGGVYIMVLEATARVMSNRVFLGGGFIAILGVIWLWEDFVAPMVRRKRD